MQGINMKVSIELEIEQVNLVLNALADLPWKTANAIIHDINGQAQRQITEKEQSDGNTESATD